eukprot:gnl/TRDRNA2_/TRDRNA2_193274_c0_seq1.p1 gnl/TRDRNA2_/TRDRNA2_193274_c0~~gnl/TRDRNA2_/TRDRNA2_193274_c0_seq1.p1  ORF type:complete len:204 (-),score=19.80 gnl/TRDRNA2_/TRDRNA2_193274_c0_seq1:6-617(-)
MPPTSDNSKPPPCARDRSFDVTASASRRGRQDVGCSGEYWTAPASSRSLTRSELEAENRFGGFQDADHDEVAGESTSRCSDHRAVTRPTLPDIGLSLEAEAPRAPYAAQRTPLHSMAAARSADVTTLQDGDLHVRDGSNHDCDITVREVVLPDAMLSSNCQAIPIANNVLHRAPSWTLIPLGLACSTCTREGKYGVDTHEALF